MMKELFFIIGQKDPKSVQTVQDYIFFYRLFIYSKGREKKGGRKVWIYIERERFYNNLR